MEMPDCFALEAFDPSCMQSVRPLKPLEWIQVVGQLNSLRAAMIELRHAYEQIPAKIALHQAHIAELRRKIERPTDDEREAASGHIAELRRELRTVEVEMAGASGGRQARLVARKQAIDTEVHALVGQFRGSMPDYTQQEIEARIALAEADIRSLEQKLPELEVRAWMVRQAIRVAIMEIKNGGCAVGVKGAE